MTHIERKYSLSQCKYWNKPERGVSTYTLYTLCSLGYTSIHILTCDVSMVFYVIMLFHCLSNDSHQNIAYHEKARLHSKAKY